MTLVPLKGLKRYTSKGREYLYHRATGRRVVADPNTAEFVLEVRELERKAIEKKAMTGTVVALIDDYRASNAFGKLATATITSYERAFAVIIKMFGTRKIVEITPPFIAQARDIVERKRKRWMANYFLTVMALLCDFAIERGLMEGQNPAKAVKRIRKSRCDGKPNRPWSRAECSTVLETAPPYLKVPIALAMFGGFRKRDVLTMTRIAVTRRRVVVADVEVEIDCLVHRTSKRSTDVVVPMHPELARVLAAAPKHDAGTVAANSRGGAWTEAGFNSTFFKLIKGLEAAGRVDSGLTFHGLRHTVGTRLLEAGARIEDIRRLLGQRSAAMAQHYSESADVAGAHSVLIGEMKVLDTVPAAPPDG